MQLTSSDDIKKLGRILSVWAHPDDETFLAAGVMAIAAQNGQDIACVTATKGELGIQDENKWPASQLGEIRAKELEQMLDIIGCKNHHWLGYKDGECADIDIVIASNLLTEIIKEFKPDTILTFGPDGWTGHSDHAAVSNWVAFATKKTAINVYHIVHTPEHYEKYFKKADELLNIFFNIDMPPLLPKEDCDIYIDLPENILNKKYQALKACPSQTTLLFELFNEQFLRETLGAEAFIKAK